MCDGTAGVPAHDQGHLQTCEAVSRRPLHHRRHRCLLGTHARQCWHHTVARAGSTCAPCLRRWRARQRRETGVVTCSRDCRSDRRVAGLHQRDRGAAIGHRRQGHGARRPRHLSQCRRLVPGRRCTVLSASDQAGVCRRARRGRYCCCAVRVGGVVCHECARWKSGADSQI